MGDLDADERIRKWILRKKVMKVGLDSAGSGVLKTVRKCAR